MNKESACRIFNIEEPYNLKEVKKKYYSYALRYHPDKNPSEHARLKFQEIQQAYEFFNKEEEIQNTNLSYETFLKYFTGSLDNPSQYEYIESILTNVLCICEKQAKTIVDSLPYEKFVKIYKILKLYRHIFQLSPDFYEFMEKKNIYWLSQSNLKKRHIKEAFSEDDVNFEKDPSKHYETKYNQEWDIKYYVPIEPEIDINDKETMILRPTLDDIMNDNVYKCKFKSFQLIIPLWHHELTYGENENEFDVKIIPSLPSNNYWIDTDNNLNQYVEYSLYELWNYAIEEKYMEVFFGKKRLLFYPHHLNLKEKQIWTWKNEGFSQINSHNIYDISKRSDILLHIHIAGIM